MSDGDAVDVIMTTEGSTDVIAAVRDSPARLGATSDIAGVATNLFFLDFPFTDPRATISDHVETVAAVEPALTVAPDIEKGRTLAEVTRIGDRLLEHADDVIVVPKSVRPGEVPDRFRIGVTVASFGSSAPWGLFEYVGTGPVHVLGGPPGNQLEVANTLPVASLDTSTLGMRARFGTWDRDDGAIDSPDPSWDFRRRLEYALTEYHAAWNS